MECLVGKDENAWVSEAWTWIHAHIAPGSRVFLPAGGTPTPLYRRFCREPSSLLRTLRFVQIDEILTGPMCGYFRRYFETELAPFQSQMEWIDRADRAADFALLGVGVNGHVAFHEPGLPRHFTSGCIRLSDETLGYLKLREPTWGVTYGVGAFMQAKKILVLAQGAAKQAILQKAVLPQSQLPIAWILQHQGSTLISDFKL